jgi:nicotinamidase/pyrazinamidase
MTEVQIPARRALLSGNLTIPELDYCVKYGALDAHQLGLTTCVILDGCRGIELELGDIARALDEMKRAGAILLKSSDL